LVVWADPILKHVSSKLAAHNPLERASTSVPLNLAEATVRLPPRGRIFVAHFTGPDGLPKARSTGQTDRQAALKIARNWESEAPCVQAMNQFIVICGLKMGHPLKV
jgi:hypothetical protein